MGGVVEVVTVVATWSRTTTAWAAQSDKPWSGKTAAATTAINRRQAQYQLQRTGLSERAALQRWSNFGPQGGRPFRENVPHPSQTWKESLTVLKGYGFDF
jgi:hypothetical protein